MKKLAQTKRFSDNAYTEIFTLAFAPHLLQIMSIHKNMTQLKAKPQSKAMYL
jgi:hypothetical protein